MELSEDQAKVYSSMRDWLARPSAMLTVGGYAGTGKTTLLSRLIADHPGTKFVCAAFTGKAANVLAQKLTDEVPVSTLHSLLYLPNEKDGKVSFTRKGKRIEADVLVIDEASMVGSDMVEDLLWHEVPILAIGDHGQLPPVEGPSTLMEKPDLRLDRIHRQAEKSPILRLSQIVRETGRFPEELPEGITQLKWKEFNTDIRGRASYDDFRSTVVLTYTNSTRVAVNRNIRWAKHGEDASDDDPKKGDIVVCLRNAPPVYNGMRGVIESVSKSGFNHIAMVRFPDDGNRLFGQTVLTAQFGREKTFSTVAELAEHKVRVRDVRSAGQLYDYGYAMTVHKSQGSGFRSVYLVREKPGRVDDDTYARWAYTGITRAVDELVLVSDRFAR